MADGGVQSPNLPRATTLDSILGNSGETTSRQLVTDLAAQLVASEPMRLGTMMGQLYNAYTDLPAITAQVTPWVIADPDPAKIGIYKVSGGAWVWALPLPYSIIPASIGDGDTVNVRQLNTALPVVDGTAVIIPIVGTNTASPVVIHINGGDAITLKSNSGADIDVGGLPGSGRLMAIREGAILRLNNDVVATAVLAATERARDLAKEYANAPEDEAVDGEGNYSAKHWALKAAEADAGSGATAAKVAAQEARDVAVAAAQTAGLSAVDSDENAALSLAKAAEATSAAAAAVLARDASFALGPKYATEAAGRAAVADGVAFLVQGSGDVAAYEYRRTDASASVLIATYPSKAALDNGLAGKVGTTDIDPDGGFYYFFGHRLICTFRSAVDDRVLGGFDAEGRFHGKMPFEAGKNITLTRDPSTGVYNLSLGTVPGIVPVGDVEIQGDGSTVYVDGEKAVFGLDALGRYPIYVLEDGVVVIPKLRSPNADLNIEPALLAELATNGDSLTAGAGGGGITIATAAAAVLGVPAYTRAIGGQWSNQIAYRQGGLVADVTFSGNQIVSGANTITQINGTAIATLSATAGWPGLFLTTTSPDAAARSIKVKIGLITGTLTRTKPSDESYVFTPDAGPTLPVTCPARSPMVVLGDDTSSFGSDADAKRINSLWYGRNDDWTSPDPIMVALEASVQRLIEAGNKRFVVMTVLNGNYAAEVAGQSRYDQLMAINRAIIKRWPQNTLDIRRWLIDRALSDLGITPTTQDSADIANDIVPTSLRSDNIHLTGTAYGGVGQQVAAFITSKGWL